MKTLSTFEICLSDNGNSVLCQVRAEAEETVDDLKITATPV